MAATVTTGCHGGRFDGGGGAPSRSFGREGRADASRPTCRRSTPPPPPPSPPPRRPTGVPTRDSVLTRIVPTCHGSCHVPAGRSARVRGPSTATTSGRGSSTPSWTSWRRRARRHVDAGGRRAGRHQRAHAVPLLPEQGRAAALRRRLARPPGAGGDGATAPSTCRRCASTCAGCGSSSPARCLPSTCSTAPRRAGRCAWRGCRSRGHADRRRPAADRSTATRRADVVDLIVAICSSSMFLELVDRMGHDPVEAADLVADLVELIVEHEAGRRPAERREHHDRR